MKERLNEKIKILPVQKPTLNNQAGKMFNLNNMDDDSDFSPRKKPKEIVEEVLPESAESFSGSESAKNFVLKESEEESVHICKVINQNLRKRLSIIAYDNILEGNIAH